MPVMTTTPAGSHREILRQYAPAVPRPPDTAPRAASTVAIALGAGVFGAIQPEVNTELGQRVGSSLVASLVNFAVALAVVVVVVGLRPSTRRRLRTIRTWP